MGSLLGELVVQEENGAFNMSWFNTLLNRSKAPESFKDHCRQLPFELSKGIGNVEESPCLACSRVGITDDIRRQCETWRGCIYDNLNIYAGFPDQKTKYEVFYGIFLHEISIERRSMRYKLVLYYIEESAYFPGFHGMGRRV